MGKPRIRRSVHNRLRTFLTEDPKGVEIQNRIRNNFIEQFGREPELEDPLFCDPESDVPKPYPVDRFVAEVSAVMEKAGIDPVRI